MNQIEIKNTVEKLIETFLKAGRVCLDLRKKGLIKKIKSDNTPVSNGDLEVNKIISEKISEVTPTIPIVSEETSENRSNKELKDFWLIDPIDGTYDYINNLEEFTINAGLIINRKPVAGLIFAFELMNGNLTKLNLKKNFDNNEIKFVSYSNKLKPEIEKIHKKLNVKKFFRMKSSLKFCLIAAGEYDGYVAEPRAYEWDIAAGHAIMKHAGSIVTDFEGNEILYGKKDFKNTSLIIKNIDII